MAQNSPYATLDQWIAREAVPFSFDVPDALETAVDRMVASLGDAVDLLAVGEPLHGGEEFLLLRNRLFQHLAARHGYTAIAVESSFPRGPLVNEYVLGRGPGSYDALQDIGFSHGFGRYDANRELVEWMRQHNAQRDRKLHFYGFDAPSEMTGADSPRQLLTSALDYLASIEPTAARPRRARVEELLGNDADWSNPAATFDPTQSIGLSPNATALRIETEDLVAELRLRRPELIARSDLDRYLEAGHHAALARQMLNYHAALARPSPDRISECLGLRDVMMADNLAHILAREQRRPERGKVLAFAHNSHLQRGPAQWQLGPQRLTWWPAGAHLHATLGPRYAIIGAALGWSDANGIPAPDVGSFEHRLTSTPGPTRLIPTHRGEGLHLAGVPTRTTPWKNPSYFPLTARSFADFDWLAILDSTGYTRGAPPPPH